MLPRLERFGFEIDHFRLIIRFPRAGAQDKPIPLESGLASLRPPMNRPVYLSSTLRLRVGGYRHTAVLCVSDSIALLTECTASVSLATSYSPELSLFAACRLEAAEGV